MNEVTLFQIQYKSFATNLASLYLAYGLKKEKIQFDIKLYPWQRIKRKFPQKIIMGGVSPVEVAEETLRKFKFVDFIV